MKEIETRPLHVLFTMDCVPADGAPAVPGPRSWDEAERSMRCFAEGLSRLGFKGSFFVAPECLRRLRDAVQELKAGGMELGVLCHPQLSGYQSYLGSYGFDRQREVVRLDATMWQDRMGERAESFRAGFFSANDYTYQVLCLEGFRQGSCSLPGRIDLDQCSLWQTAYPFAHHTDPLDRRIPGTMEFLETPVSSDFEARGDVRAETYTPPHLRIEDPCINEHAASLIAKCLSRMEADRVPVRTLVFVTHNTVGWGGAEDPHLERLENLARLLRDAAAERQLSLVPATTSSVHHYADSVWEGRTRPGETEGEA